MGINAYPLPSKPEDCLEETWVLRVQTIRSMVVIKKQ